MWVVQNADSFILSRFLDHKAIGLYNFASRTGFMVSFLPQGFRMSLRPIRKTAVYEAYREEYGMAVANGQLLAYQIALLADIAGPGTAQWLADGWGRMLSALLAPGAGHRPTDARDADRGHDRPLRVRVVDPERREVDAHAVVQVKAAKQVSRKQRLIHNLGAVAPPAFDAAHRQVGLESPLSQFGGRKSFPTGRRPDGKPTWHIYRLTKSRRGFRIEICLNSVYTRAAGTSQSS
jgi:hypothetical protein